MIKTIFLGQVHEDPAPFAAAYHLIKRCVDNGVKVIVGHEGWRSLDQQKEQETQFIQFFKEKEDSFYLGKFPSETLNILSWKTQRSPEYLALLRYIEKNKLEFVPLEREELIRQIDTESKQHQVTSNSAQSAQDVMEARFQVTVKHEKIRIAGMVNALTGIHERLREAGHNNALVILVNMGFKHQERLAKHARLSGIEVNIIQCNPNQVTLRHAPRNYGDALRANDEDKERMSNAVDSAQIRSMHVDVQQVNLSYNHSNTTINDCNHQSRYAVGDITLADLQDQDLLTHHLDSVIPAITLPSADGTAPITGYAYTFDKHTLERHGFAKARIPLISREKRNRIHELSSDIVLIPDNNYSQYIVFYPRLLTKELTVLVKAPESQVESSTGEIIHQPPAASANIQSGKRAGM